MRSLSRPIETLHRLRTWLILRRIVLVARLRRSIVELDVAPDVRFGRGVVFNVKPGSRNTLRIGPRSTIGDDVAINLKGATLDWGAQTEIRRGTVINVSGTFRLAGRNIISYANVIHCATSISMEECASTNEYVSIIDSTHHHDGASDFFYENTSAAPISIGPNVWVCNKASVLMGTTVGANAVIASHAVVNRDVPEATVVGGVPAKVLAPRTVGGGAMRFGSAGAASVSESV